MKILLLPWFNYSKHHLMKYHQMYKHLGFNNIKIINYEVKDIISNRGWLEIREQSQKQKYDLIHCFSGGSLYYYNLIKSGVNCEKIIYDSGPMFPTSDCVSNYVTNYYFNNNNVLNNVLNTIFKNSIDTYWNYEKNVIPKEKLIELSHDIDYNNLILNKDSNYLIINDINDNLVQLDKIYDLLHNNLLKNNVKIQLFENSKHVQHLRYNEDIYIDNIYNFIKNN